MTDSMDVTVADFTPNPGRAIWVEGQFNEALLERLRPRILDLTAQSREPITVFINSGGGAPEVARSILRLLVRTTPGDERVSRIITVAAPRAASAAANFLSAGDFAVAHPGSTLLYHGGRWPISDLVAAGEYALLYARTLPTFREMTASDLALVSMRRFRFIVSALRPLFAQHRADQGDPTLADLNCFQQILRGKLSPAGQKVLELAVPLCESYTGLLAHFHKRLRRRRASPTREHLQKLMLHASMAFEYESRKGKPAWDGGLGRFSEHFYFLNAYFDFGRLSDWAAGHAEIPAAETDVEASQFSLFFLALCRALQEGENELTPMDAMWLGLIDTVRADLAVLSAS
jgi:hypothetical protein